MRVYRTSEMNGHPEGIVTWDGVEIMNPFEGC
jgi:hypothetical protein